MGDLGEVGGAEPDEAGEDVGTSGGGAAEVKVGLTGELTAENGAGEGGETGALGIEGEEGGDILGAEGAEGAEAEAGLEGADVAGPDGVAVGLDGGGVGILGGIALGRGEAEEVLEDEPAIDTIVVAVGGGNPCAAPGPRARAGAARRAEVRGAPRASRCRRAPCAPRRTSPGALA